MDNPFEVLLDPVADDTLHTKELTRIERAGRYKIGAPERPPIQHDNGHLDKFPRRAPNAEDYYELAKWKMKVIAAEQLCRPGLADKFEDCHSQDMTEAIEAYKHFLYGNGKARQIQYERYISGDSSGSKVIPAIVDDFQIEIKRLSVNRHRFSVTSTEYSIGGKDSIAPYPSSTNWQKALGAHSVWVSADVNVSANTKGILLFSANLVLHMEDRYNFNPGKSDAATGIPDAENGRFELTGLAHQYMNYGEVRRHVEWNERPFGNTRISSGG